MNQLKLKTGTGASRIHIGESMKNLSKLLPNAKTVIITDPEVRNLYGHLFPTHDVIEINPGEEVKTLETVEMIYQTFLELEVDRSSFIVGIGGGIVCDIAGFCASTYMRGLPFGFVPSTLVAQVDAGIGGKNGVNFKGYKNIIGVFRQPQFVLVDCVFLQTLTKRAFLCGVSEIIKSALIRSAGLFEILEKNWNKLLKREKEILEKIVTDTISIKTDIVQTDAEEKGERRILNFGHTIGHAIEKLTSLPHGEAISIGMSLATDISVARKRLSPEDAFRIKDLLQRVNLPTLNPCDAVSIMKAIKKDKKRHKENIYFILLAGIGQAETAKTSYEELEEYIYDLHEYR